MSSVRFTEVVKNCGRPESYVLLTDPTKDRELQAALKAGKVMTVFQASLGGKADHGEVGLETGPGRQFLVFPKSLKAYAGRPVIGIKYDLLESAEPAWVAASAPSAKKPARSVPVKREPAKPKPVEPKKEKPAPPVVLQRPEPTAATAKPAERIERKKARSRKLVSFEPAGKDESDEVVRLKKQVRRAMAALEEGKEVAAFNLLKRILE